MRSLRRHIHRGQRGYFLNWEDSNTLITTSVATHCHCVLAEAHRNAEAEHGCRTCGALRTKRALSPEEPLGRQACQTPTQSNTPVTRARLSAQTSCHHLKQETTQPDPTSCAATRIHNCSRRATHSWSAVPLVLPPALEIAWRSAQPGTTIPKPQTPHNP